MSRRRPDADVKIGVHVGFEQRLLARLKRHFAARSLIVVGFSGGADSLALAAALARVTPLSGASVELLHVDHGLRASSGEEADHARELAAFLGMRCSTAKVDERRLAAHVGVGIEEAARRERYRIFASAIRAKDGAAVALAHHQTDQAETVLLHLLRGSGVHGAAGMQEHMHLTVPWWEDADARPTVRLPVWRPMLGESRDEVRAYAAALEVRPNEDSSNADTSYRRNAVRHEVLPVLERVSPGSTAALARYAHHSSQADDLLQSLVAAEFKQARLDGNKLCADAIKQIHPALKRALIHAWLTSFRIEPGAERVDAVLDLLARPRRDRRIEVGRGLCVTINDGQVEVGDCADAAGSAAVP
ncbi:MAG: tRNA lysidine(34) synthetase TilS [Thermomicrobiales bacterium]